MGARDIPEIVVFNKADLVDDDTRMLLRGLEPRAVFVSSRTGEGVAELRAAVEAALVALLAHFVGLLGTFIGEGVTLRVLGESGPARADDDMETAT